MPRTAPAPNIPAIPGMNPGVIIKAGGGAGGGSGAGGGKGRGGKKGAGTGHGQENAAGGQKSASDCGTGSTGGCTNCTSGASAGDPIDVSDGTVFTRPSVDLLLSGRIDIEFKRKYLSSQRDEEWGLGRGWSHSFAWRLTEKHRSVLVEGPMGSVVEFFFDVHHKVSMGTGGWVLSQVQGGYVLDCKDGFEHHFRGVGPDREPFVLTHISAINGNAITIERDERNRVARVVDPADRVIHFDWGSHGRVSQVWMQDPNTGKRIVFAAYGYDSAGHLVRHEDADGNATEYEYDASHRLTRYTLPTALSFCFKYDASHRCIESWGAYPFADIALDEELPQTFENGDPILGIYHVKLEFDDDYTEVLDTQRLRRYHFKDGKISGADSGLGFTSRIFDEAGNMMSHTDANGATSHYEYDVRGRLTSETDPLGHRFEFRRDRHGNVIENVDPSGRTIKRVLDQDDNPVELIDQAGAVTRYRYAADGQMTHRIEPDGSTVEFRSDAHGNLVEVVYPSGERWSYEWDYFGRLIRLTSPVGKVTEFTYTDAGRLVYLQDSLGKEVRASYNGLGDLVSVTNAQGTTQFRWGGYRWLAEVVYPNGDVEQARYNRMGWLTRRVNELGQSERYHRSVLGLVTRIESFDGSVTEYEYDAMRRVLADREGPSIGESFDRDALGRVTKTTYADGTVEQYTYDEHGHLLSATSPWVTSRWVYNDVGLCIEEEHVIDGESTVVRNEYDVMRRKVRTSSSLQHSQRFIWRNGLRSQVVLDDRLVVGETRDVLRRLVGQELPGGARVNSVFDEYSRLERRWVGAPRRQTGDAEQQPHRTLEQWFNYDADDQLTVSSMAEGETIYYEYDSRRRLLSKRSSTGEREEFSHDSASNLFEAGSTAVGRVYDRGNRLLRRGATSFDYDAGGRLRFKANMLDDGTTERWEYRWSAQGLLDSVHRPDGRVVRFTYDALERRTLKRVFHGDGEGGALISSTRYVWDGVQILHEVERTRSQDYDWVVKIRSYFYEDGRLGPQGHCDVVEQGGTRSVGEWVFYVGDVLETPTTLIDGEGAVKGELLRSVYGKTSTRPGSTVTSTARFEGQFEDVETGLFYNYHRYYDPETGRYISPDPIGTNGLLNLYQYCTNPVGYVDPFGLHELNVQLVQLNEDGTEKRIHQPGAVDGHRNGQGGGFSSGGKHKGNPKRIPDTGKPGTDTSLFGLGKAHTERQALEWAKKVHGDKLKGSRMDMRGQFPPCTACSNAMRQFARNEECEITYEYPTDRKIRYSPKESDASPQAVTQQSELKALCESYQSRTHTPEAKKEAGAAERARLGYQTSETSTNVAADGRTGSSGDNYTKEKDQATQGGVKEPKPFPRPEPEASQTAGSKRSADSALGGSAAKKPRRGIE